MSNKAKHLIKFTKLRHQQDYIIYIKCWKKGLEDGMRGKTALSQHIRRYIFKKYNNKCTKCGWAKRNKYTKRIPLEINHKDGNFKNNKENNLDLICPNCHSLTKNYRSMNRGKGRPR